MKTRLRIPAALAALLLFLAVGAGAQDGAFHEDFTTKEFCDTLFTIALWDTVAGELRLHPYEMSHMGGLAGQMDARAVAVDGDLAYVAAGGHGFQVLDVGDPLAPVRLATLPLAGGEPRAVAVAGDLVYVCDGRGLQAIDVTVSALPVWLGGWESPGEAGGVAVAGDRAFVADGEAGLQVVDVSMPAVPLWLGGVDLPGSARDVALAGDRAYVAAGASGLRVIDISVPGAPAVVGSLDTPGELNALVLAGDVTYLADGSGGFHAVDISDPAAPALLASLATPGEAVSLDPSGDHVYLAESMDRGALLRRIDVRDPAAPALGESVTMGGTAAGVDVEGELAYVAGRDGGLQIFHIADRLAPPVGLSLTDTVYPALSLAVSGDLAFVGTGGYYYEIPEGHLEIIDIADPAAPAVLDCVSLPWLLDVAVAGDYAYCVTDAGEYWFLSVVDVSDPEAPALVGGCQAIPPGPEAIALAGDCLYLACNDQSRGFTVLDISTPASPVVIGDHATPSGAYGVAAAGDRAFVATALAGLTVFNVADPAAPVYLGGVDTPGFAFDVALAGDIAFVADGNSGVQVIDIADPENPAIVGAAPTPNFARKLALAGDVLYVSYDYYPGATGVKAFDVADPAHPVDLGLLPTPTGALELAVAGDHFFLAGGAAGLLVGQAFDRLLSEMRPYGQSLPLPASGETVVRVRLSTVQTETVQWEVSADGGEHWQSVPPDDAWTELAYPDPVLLWRSTHIYSELGTNPTAHELLLEWDYDATSAGGTPPPRLALSQNHPNPFNPVTTIRFSLPVATPVDLRIFAPDGRLVRALLHGEPLPAGEHVHRWDGRDDSGADLPSGIYLCRLATPSGRATRKMLLLD